jgi:hypothetical protein
MLQLAKEYLPDPKDSIVSNDIPRRQAEKMMVSYVATVIRLYPMAASPGNKIEEYIKHLIQGHITGESDGKQTESVVQQVLEKLKARKYMAKNSNAAKRERYVARLKLAPTPTDRTQTQGETQVRKDRQHSSQIQVTKKVEKQNRTREEPVHTHTHTQTNGTINKGKNQGHIDLKNDEIPYENFQNATDVPYIPKLINDAAVATLMRLNASWDEAKREYDRVFKKTSHSFSLPLMKQTPEQTNADKEYNLARDKLIECKKELKKQLDNYNVFALTTGTDKDKIVAANKLLDALEKMKPGNGIQLINKEAIDYHIALSNEITMAQSAFNQIPKTSQLDFKKHSAEQRLTQVRLNRKHYDDSLANENTVFVRFLNQIQEDDPFEGLK